MSLYQESKISVAQNTNNQRDVHLSSTSSFHDNSSSPEHLPMTKPNHFSSSIRSDPLVGLIDGPSDMKGSPALMNNSTQPNCLSKTIIDSSKAINQATIDDKKFNQLSNFSKSSQKSIYGLQNQSSNFNSHVTFGDTQQNLINNGTTPNFQSPNNVNPMFNTNLGQSPNQSNTNWISQIPRSMSTSNMRQKAPYPTVPSTNKGSGVVVTIPTNIPNSSNGMPNTSPPNSYVQNHRNQFSIQDSATHPATLPDFKIPDPVYFEDEESGTYGVRCVCGKAHHDGLLVQCDKCQFWLHAICNCIARESKDEPFFCPFCRLRIIRCKCGNNSSYDIPIVQCAQCKYWVHKRCEHLGFGAVPTTFICSNCGGNEFTLPLLKPDFKNNNKVSFVDCDRYEVIQSIPEGQFRNFVIADLNRPELHLHETVGRYFQEFAIPLFQKTHEFWKVFVDTLVTLLNCDKNDVLETIDDYAKCFLYSKNTKLHKFAKPIKFSMAESILPIVEASLSSLPQVDDRNPKELYLNPSGSVCITESCDEDDFICELPGFLVHTDEVRADDGIPLNFIRLYSSDLVIDMDGSTFQLPQKINRSFHFNCYAKLYISHHQIEENEESDDDNKEDQEKDDKELKVREEVELTSKSNSTKSEVPSENNRNINLFEKVRVGLFATRMKGPLQDVRRGTPIAADSQLFLPLDGEIPYTLPKCEWKSPRAKAKVKNNSRSKQQQKKNEVGQHPDSLNPINLSLLTAFCEDIVPPIHIQIVNEREAMNRSHANSNARSRRASRVKAVDT